MEDNLSDETVISQPTQNLGNTEQGAGSSKKEALNNLKKALENLDTNNKVDAYLEIWKAQRDIEDIYQREGLGISPPSPENKQKRNEKLNEEIDNLRQEYTNEPDKFESFKKIVDERSEKMITRLKNDLNGMPEQNFQQEAKILRENFETALERAQAVSSGHRFKGNINNIEMSLLRLFAVNELGRYTELLANINKGNNVDEDDLSKARGSVEQRLQENNEFAKRFTDRLMALNTLLDEAEKESQEQMPKSAGPPRWFTETREKPTSKPQTQTPNSKPQIPDSEKYRRFFQYNKARPSDKAIKDLAREYKIDEEQAAFRLATRRIHEKPTPKFTREEEMEYLRKLYPNLSDEEIEYKYLSESLKPRRTPVIRTDKRSANAVSKTPRPGVGMLKHRADEITEEKARFDQEVAKIIEQEKGNAKAIAKKLQKASEKVDRLMFSKNAQKRQNALNEHEALLEAFRSLNFTHENYNNPDISSLLKLHADLHSFTTDFNRLGITKKDVRKFFPRLKILRRKPKPSEQDKLTKISYYIQNKKARKDKTKIVKNLKEK